MGVKPLIEGGILYLEVIRQKEVPLAVPFVDERGHRLDAVDGVHAILLVGCGVGVRVGDARTCLQGALKIFICWLVNQVLIGVEGG